MATVLLPTLEDLEQLAHDLVVNGRVEIGADWRVVLEIGADEWSSIDDVSDYYGRVEFIDDRGSWRGYPTRPSWCTGAGEILRTVQGNYWWQPAPDLVSRRAGGFESDDTWRAARDATRRSLLALLEDGFRVVSVALERRCDAGCWHEHNVASLGGIDSLENGYLDEITRELLEQLGDGLDHDAPRCAACGVEHAGRCDLNC